jgi:competence protein ComFC
MPAANTSLSSFCRGLLDLLYPPKCALCGELGTEAVCPECRAGFAPQHPNETRQVAGLSAVRALFAYADVSGRAVKRLKYERVTSLAAPMGQLMLEGAEEHELLGVDLIVPVPIHWTRRCRRGFNQSELLCEAFGRPALVADLPNRPNGTPAVCYGALRRIRATRPQVGLDRERRLRNLSGAFRAHPCVSGMRVLLIDDVLTTGHTAQECAKTLREAGAAEVKALFFAGDRMP